MKVLKEAMLNGDPGRWWPHVSGFIYQADVSLKERNPRFYEGQRVHTSPIVKQEDFDGYSIVTTQNSIYRVEWIKNEPAASR